MYRQQPHSAPSLLLCEGHVLDLIAAGAPLTDVLNEICTRFDVQVGNVASLVLFSDDEEHFSHTIEQDAAQFGLSVFSCTAILSSSEELLGTFETYSCLSRGPNQNETELIERAAELASLAIQLYNREPDSVTSSGHLQGPFGRSFREGPASKN